MLKTIMRCCNVSVGTSDRSQQRTNVVFGRGCQDQLISLGLWFYFSKGNPVFYLKNISLVSKSYCVLYVIFYFSGTVNEIINSFMNGRPKHCY